MKTLKKYWWVLLILVIVAVWLYNRAKKRKAEVSGPSSFEITRPVEDVVILPADEVAEAMGDEIYMDRAVAPGSGTGKTFDGRRWCQDSNGNYYWC
jgi:hypothetical protein